MTIHRVLPLLISKEAITAQPKTRKHTHSPHLHFDESTPFDKKKNQTQAKQKQNKVQNINFFLIKLLCLYHVQWIMFQLLHTFILEFMRS